MEDSDLTGAPSSRRPPVFGGGLRTGRAHPAGPRNGQIRLHRIGHPLDEEPRDGRVLQQVQVPNGLDDSA